MVENFYKFYIRIQLLVFCVRTRNFSLSQLRNLKLFYRYCFQKHVASLHSQPASQSNRWDKANSNTNPFNIIVTLLVVNFFSINQNSFGRENFLCLFYLNITHCHLLSSNYQILTPPFRPTSAFHELNIVDHHIGRVRATGTNEGHLDDDSYGDRVRVWQMANECSPGSPSGRSAQTNDPPGKGLLPSYAMNWYFEIIAEFGFFAGASRTP